MLELSHRQHLRGLLLSCVALLSGAPVHTQPHMQLFLLLWQVGSVKGRSSKHCA